MSIVLVILGCLLLGLVASTIFGILAGFWLSGPPQDEPKPLLPEDDNDWPGPPPGI